MDKAPDAFRTISEVAEELDLPQHVLRFWETRFSQIKPMKRGGGRRYYRPDDIDLLRGIRHLLYGEGYTIRGVQRILKDHGVKFVQSVWQAGAPQPARSAGDLEEAETAGAGAEDERRRSLFGLLPAFLGSGVAVPGGGPTGRREPPIEEIEGTPREQASENGRAGAEAAWSAEPHRVGPGAAAAHEQRPAPAASSLAKDDVAKLRVTLSELAECRRLIDELLSEQS